MAITNIYTFTKEAIVEFQAKIKNWVLGVLPTKTSDLKNDSGYITASEVPSREVVHDGTMTGDGTSEDSALSVNTMTGATGDKDGTAGLVPAPTVADGSKFLKGDGTWTEVDAEPDEYLKTASVSENQLTITPKQGDPITFTGGVPADWAATESEAGYIQNVPDVLRDQVQQIVFDPDTMDTDDSVEGKVTISVKPISAFSGATADAAGTSGMVPAPVSTDRDKVLSGSGAWVSQPSKVSDLTNDSGFLTESGLPGMTGASAGADGTSGLVPAPTAADAGKYLRGDGTWATPEGGSGGSTVTSTYDSTTETLRIKIG